MPAVSVSVLEDKSIQAVHQQLGVIPLKPLKSKVEVVSAAGVSRYRSSSERRCHTPQRRLSAGSPLLGK